MSNREIKFRAWANASKVMFNPDCEDGWGLNNGDVDIKPNTILMQYTGLKDKNGKEIYEGDVLNFGNKMEVCFGFNNGEHEGWYLKRITDGYEYTMHAFTTQFEVIGNIYENPELLKN